MKDEVLKRVIIYFYDYYKYIEEKYSKTIACRHCKVIENVKNK